MNLKKNVDAEVGGEIQGVVFDGNSHDVGLSPPKRRLLALSFLP